MSPVQVGILHSLSGTLANSEAPLLDAALMAIAQINEAGGVIGQLIEPILADGASDPSFFARKARKVIQDEGVTHVFGGWTSATRKAVLPVFEELNALLWYPGQYEGLECSQNIFYTGSCPNQQVEPAVSWLLSNKGKRFYLLGGDYLFSRTVNKLIKAQLKQQEGTVVGEDSVCLGTQDFTEIVNRIKEARPDIVFNTLKGESNLAFYRQYQDAGINPSEIPIMALNVTETELQTIGEAAVGHYVCASYFQSLDAPSNRGFVENFQVRYGIQRVTSAPIETAYSQVYLWKQAVELAQSFDVERVRVAAYGQSFEAPGGLVRIEPNHHVSKVYRIGQILPKGQFELVGTRDNPIKPLPWLGVEELNFNASDVVVDMLAEVSHKVWQLEQKSWELEAATTQLQNEIVERQRVEAALRNSEGQLRALFAAMTDVVLVIDAQGRYQKIAPTKPALLYKPAEELIGKTLHEIFGQSSPGVVTATPSSLGATVSRFAVNESVSATRKGAELGAANVANAWSLDVTASRSANGAAALARSRSLMRSLKPRSNASSGGTDPNGRTYSAADTFLGYIRETLDTQQPVNFEYSLTIRDHEVWFAATLSPLSEDTVIWVARDITEQKWTEEALHKAKAELELKVEERTAALKASNDHLVAEVAERQQAEKALRVAKDQLQAVLEAVPGIVSWISSDLRYLGVNRHLAESFNLPPEAFAGQDIGFLHSSSEFNNFVREFFVSPAQEAYREVSAQVNDTPRNYLIVAQKYDQDRAAFTVGIDITERQQAEEALRAAKEQLQTVLEAVPGIVSWISSDLRYLGVNRHLAETFNLPPEAFVGQDIGFLHSSSEFNDFVREFFASPAQDACREVSAQVNGTPRNYLIVAQKYDQDRAAFTIGIDITKRQHTEEALRQAEAKYRSIFENAVEGVFQTTPDGYYLSANPALARIYGYESPEQLITSLTSVQQQLYVDSNRRAEFVRLLQKDDAVVCFESQIYRKDGSPTWISENARAVRDNNGTLLYYEGTVEDITERKRAEEALLIANEQLEIANEQLENRVEERTAALRQSNERLVIEIAERQRVEAELRALFAAMTDVITVFDAQGRYLKIVSTNSELLYSPTAELIDKTVYEVLPPKQASLFFSHIQRALNTGQTVSLEYSLIIGEEQGSRGGALVRTGEQGRSQNQNSKEVWFTANVSPMPDNCVIWVARNITERKQAEAALRQAEEKYRSIFENAAEGIFQTTPDGRYLSVNPTLAQMYGYSSPEEMITHLTNVAQQLYVNPNRRAEFIAALEQHDAVSNFEYQVYRKDGSIIWTSENARAVRDAQGRLLYYEGTAADITKRKRAEEALRIEQEKSERLLLNILPKSIAQRLKQDQQSIADRFEQVTILFADIVDFTGLSARISPTKLVNLLNEIFCTFDQLTLTHRLEKIKTIGDSYMVVGGLPTPRPDHAEAIAEMALDMQQAITRFQRDDGESFHLRLGIHTGPVVAGVIGIKKFTYDLWGDTVNVASRMESTGMAGRIQVTAATYECLKDKYCFEERGATLVKGKGEMITYWLIGRKVGNP